jgi:hypothetical protein
MNLMSSMALPSKLKRRFTRRIRGAKDSIGFPETNKKEKIWHDLSGKVLTLSIHSRK